MFDTRTVLNMDYGFGVLDIIKVKRRYGQESSIKVDSSEFEMIVLAEYPTYYLGYKIAKATGAKIPCTILKVDLYTGCVRVRKEKVSRMAC